jgi:elongation of very long chain fatty acids protein 7
MAFAHSAQLLYTDCGYPRWSVFFTLPNAVFFLMLFYDFYKKSYANIIDRRSKAAENLKLHDKTANGFLQTTNQETAKSK